MKNKILIYTDCDFFAGCEKQIENICNFKSITDSYTVLFAYRESRRYTRDLISRKLPVRLVPVFLLTPSLFLRKVDNQHAIIKLTTRMFLRMLKLSQIFYFFYFLRQIFLLYNERPDIVHINNGGYPGADSCRIMAIASKFMGIKKVIFTINNMAVPTNNPIERFLDKKVNQSVDYFITASQAASQELIKVRGIGQNKIKSIPNAVLFDHIAVDSSLDFKKEFNVPDGTLIMGSAGLLIERKGYDVLVESAKLLPKDINWMIFIFGEGPMRLQLEDMILEYGLEKRIFLPGFRSSIHSYINVLDVFILPSVANEDMPNAINEAMLMNKPIIGSNTAGIPEQIDDGINGFLVDKADHIQLAASVKCLLKLDDKSRLAMGKNSNKKYMSSFSYCLAMEQYKRIYDAKLS